MSMSLPSLTHTDTHTEFLFLGGGPAGEETPSLRFFLQLPFVKPIRCPPRVKAQAVWEEKAHNSLLTGWTWFFKGLRMRSVGGAFCPSVP